MRSVTIGKVSATGLIGDDDVTFRRFARRLLGEAGFAVVGEGDRCASRIETAGAVNPQAVLLDILLADGCGLDVALDEAPARGFIRDRSSGEAFAALVSEQ